MSIIHVRLNWKDGSSLMESKLKAGTTLVIDRYSYSGVAFSAAKGLDLGWCKVRAFYLNWPICGEQVVYDICNYRVGSGHPWQHCELLQMAS
jgi:hypothetical protein